VGSQFQERTSDGKDRRTAGHRCRRHREDNGRGEADDLLEGDITSPERHAIAIALRRQDDVDGKIDRRGNFEGEETFCDIDTPYRSGPSKLDQESKIRKRLQPHAATDGTF
jgi:hypothetical protein